MEGYNETFTYRYNNNPNEMTYEVIQELAYQRKKYKINTPLYF